MNPDNNFIQKDMNKVWSKLKSFWKDPVISKIIAYAIIGVLSSIPVIIQKIKGVPIIETLNKELTFKYFELILIALILLTIYLLPKWIKKKKRDSQTSMTEDSFNEEYTELKSNEEVFKYFDELSKRVNSRLRLDEIPQDIKDYYLAKHIIFDPNPGYSIYHFTIKGDHFFKLRSIEKIESRNKQNTIITHDKNANEPKKETFNANTLEKILDVYFPAQNKNGKEDYVKLITYVKLYGITNSNELISLIEIYLDEIIERDANYFPNKDFYFNHGGLLVSILEKDNPEKWELVKKGWKRVLVNSAIQKA